MSNKQDKPNPQRQDKRRQIREALDRQAQERRLVEFPLPDPPMWKPMG